MGRPLRREGKAVVELQEGQNAVQCALRHMRPGEHALVWATKDHTTDTKHALVLIELELQRAQLFLQSTQDIEADPTLTYQELMAYAKRAKAAGNEHYQQKEYKQASTAYNKGIFALKRPKTCDDGEAHSLLAILYCNLAATYLQQNKTTEAENASRKALELRPDNAKAHYRLAQALSSKPGGSIEAWEEINKAAALEPGNSSIQKLREAIKVKHAKEQTSSTFWGKF